MHDIIIPVLKGGSITERNIELLCGNCTHQKRELPILSVFHFLRLVVSIYIRKRCHSVIH